MLCRQGPHINRHEIQKSMFSSPIVAIVMSFFKQASHFLTSDSSFVSNETTYIVNNGMSELQYLYKHVARGACHDSKDQYEKPKCHPDTRKQLLSDLHEWIMVPEKETGIMFLHGPAGSGKSCIARSVCELAASGGLLGASFFFWRSSSTRNNESRLVTTLAYQLAERNSELRYHILSEISQNPRIVEMPMEIQFRKLIFEPCSKVPQETLHAQVIVLDGLDECLGEASQISILRMIAKAVRYEGFPIGFFVTSRPELHLQEVLDSKEIIFATNVISLNRIPGVLHDIRTVLESGFVRILNNPRFKRVFKSVPRPWPTSENIDKLVRRSSGQFIYAATVLKFISVPDCNPVSQLETVLQIRDSGNASPLADLDLLYHEILSKVSDRQLTLKVLGYVIAVKDLGRPTRHVKELRLKFSPDITRAILHNQNRLLLVVEQLLGLPEGMAYHALNQLHSLISLHVGSESTRRQLTIDFYHKSFQDFLTTKKRSTTFFVSLGRSHMEIARSCLEFMSRPRYETEAHHVGWIYSQFQWHVHMLQSCVGSKIDLAGFNIALKRCFSESHDHLNLSTLKNASELLGLSGGHLPAAIAEVDTFGNTGRHGLLSMKDLMHLVDDVRRSVCFRTEAKKDFEKSYVYPLWRNYFQTYKDEPYIKQLLLLNLTFVVNEKQFSFSDTDKCRILRELGLISDDEESAILSSRSAEISNLVSGSRGFYELPLREFLQTAEYSGPFHCTREDFLDIYAGVYSFATR